MDMNPQVPGPFSEDSPLFFDLKKSYHGSKLFNLLFLLKSQKPLHFLNPFLTVSLALHGAVFFSLDLNSSTSEEGQALVALDLNPSTVPLEVAVREPRPSMIKIRNSEVTPVTPKLRKKNDRAETSADVAEASELGDGPTGGGQGLSKTPSFEMTGTRPLHPYLMQIWKKLSRESRALSLRSLERDLRLSVALDLEKSGVISNVSLTVERGKLVASEIQQLSRKFLALRRLDPVPDEIAPTGIQLVYRMNIN
jgi:hypothetical protein